MIKTVLITGVAGGIGCALSNVFRQNNYHVIGTDIITCDHVDAFVQADLAQLVNDANTRSLFSASVNSYLNDRALVGIINNAATQILGSVTETNIDDFQKSLSINLTAPLVLTQLFIQDLIKNEGAVVNIGSVHARVTKPGFVSYATTKGALLALTRSMAVDLAPSGVRVNIVQPAATNTSMLREGFGENKEMLSRLESFHPLGRIATPEDVAKAALFLMSDDSNFMTGSALDLDGGVGVRLHDPE